MKAAVLTTMLACFPAFLAAQQSSAAASATASAQASVSVPASYSAESKAKIKAAFQAALDKNLPDQPMRQRIDEGQANGATEAQVGRWHFLQTCERSLPDEDAADPLGRRGQR